MCRDQNEETSTKLQEEKEKYDTLKEDRIKFDHNLKNRREDLKEDALYNKETGEIIKKLQAEIDKLDDTFGKKTKEEDAEKKINAEETKKNRTHLQKKSALVAKSSFIEENYDYCTNVK